MIVPMELIRVDKQYRIKIRDPLSDNFRSNGYSSEAIELYKKEFKSKKIDDRVIHDLCYNSHSGSAGLYVLSRRPDIVTVEAYNKNAITMYTRIRYSTKKYGANVVKSRITVKLEDIIFLEEAVRSEHYFLKTPIKQTRDTIKVCHIELNRERALELIERLMDFVSLGGENA